MSSNRILLKKDVPAFIDSLRSNGVEVIAPIKEEVGAIFSIVKSGNDVILNYINTAYPPKKFFIPDNEVLFEYKKRKSTYELSDNIESKRRVIFGIRPCDVHALFALDKLFIDDLKDPYYMSKRKNTLIIAVNCKEAGPNCFCKSMGTDKLENGYDLLMTDVGDKFFVQTGSTEGEKIIGISLFKKSEVGPEKIELKFERTFNANNVENRLLKVFDDERWKNVAEKCLSCGACTLVCPTCYCFNVIDQPNFDDSGVRKKVVSYCMLLEFSRVAGGDVFRKDRTERCKQFVYHKLSYFKKKFGKQLCIGCGRCIDICPVNIDFFDTAEKILEKNKENE
jgi:sulfhydrogenase subunit beta (sulfur reductase)